MIAFEFDAMTVYIVYSTWRGAKLEVCGYVRTLFVLLHWRRKRFVAISRDEALPCDPMLTGYIVSTMPGWVVGGKSTQDPDDLDRQLYRNPVSPAKRIVL
jgi:hypothetical protein